MVVLHLLLLLYQCIVGRGARTTLYDNSRFISQVVVYMMYTQMLFRLMVKVVLHLLLLLYQVLRGGEEEGRPLRQQSVSSSQNNSHLSM